MLMQLSTIRIEIGTDLMWAIFAVATAYVTAATVAATAVIRYFSANR
jgi:hypothetical protein